VVQVKLLRDLIESNIHLGQESSGGFRVLRCACCKDHSERAGFKFDGDTVGYNCFNCKARAMHEEHTTDMSVAMKRVLEAFGITREQINEVVGSAFFAKASEPKEITAAAMVPPVRLFTPEVALPPKSYPIGVHHNEELQLPLAEYILNRGLDPVALNAHFSLDPKYLNRVILPCMRDGKIIYWQARTLGNSKPRYLSPGINKDAVLWGYDNLRRSYELPLFVTEGIFDAASIDGVALLGSKINESKLQILNRSRRRRAVVIDRDDNGGRLGQLALLHGWEITFPPNGATDVNDSHQKYGKLFTIYTLMKNMTVPTGIKTPTGVTFKSQLELNMQLSLSKMGKK
jgi:hypothetical protein